MLEPRELPAYQTCGQVAEPLRYTDGGPTFFLRCLITQSTLCLWVSVLNVLAPHVLTLPFREKPP
jgi:hypothetical protein